MSKERIEQIRFNLERRLMTAASYENAATKRPDLWAHLEPVAAMWKHKANRIFARLQRRLL